jgi:predicted small lipoprotein YifL
MHRAFLTVLGALMTVFFVGACGNMKAPSATPDAARAPVVTKVSENRAVVEGEIVEIAFQNINKASGHFTYNAHLKVRHTSVVFQPDSIFSSRYEEAKAPAAIYVRLKVVRWGSLSDAQRRSLSPSGPTQSFSVPRYDGFEVGQKVRLQVDFTSSDLSHLEQRLELVQGGSPQNSTDAPP